MKNHIKVDYDVVIVGAGPAGLSAAIYACRSNLKVLILEKNVPGGKVVLTNDIENYPGFKSIDGPTLASKFIEQAQALGALFEYSGLKSFFKDQVFNITLENDKKITSKVLILATGTKENLLGVEGEKQFYGKGVSYCATCDGPSPRFKQKVVIVVGGGYSAVEEALFLTKFASEVHLIHRSKKFRVDTKTFTKLKSNTIVQIHTDCVVKKILGTTTDGVTGAEIWDQELKKTFQIKCTGVFPFIGQYPVTDYINEKDILNDTKHIVTNENMQTIIEGLFAAGDVRNTPFRQIATAVADGALAGQNAVKYIEEIVDK